MVKLLLDRGANIEAIRRGWTPPRYAVTNRHEAVVKLLLDRGANTKAKITMAEGRCRSTGLMPWDMGAVVKRLKSLINVVQYSTSK
ncbi:hypothetical protein OIDMADRAFT_151984 [Oidiodendron maius Zn]|uniref:Uncharacterized protein n=1 Tax=Oidiodendron maius (strain Zn) TaxID=913774 RepID=A0A0C3I0N4_OIDMZ|nr:hypothetical protein OIDMADRAFT_151984 [Oidiodendron maius Zn]